MPKIDKQKLLAKHRSRQENRHLPKRDKVESEILGSIIMSKKNNNIFNENMCMMYIPSVDQHYWIDYNTYIPEAEWVLGNKQSTGWKSEMVDNDVADVIIEALEMWKQHQGSHLTGFTFLVAYCLSQGIDLFEMNLVEK